MSVALALLSSVGFGFQTLFVRHGLSRDDDSTPLTAATVTLVTSCTLLAAILFVRRGVPTVPALPSLLPFLVAGVLDPGVSRLLYFEGIDRVGPSVAAALTASSPAVATILPLALGSGRVRRYAGTTSTEALASFAAAGVFVGTAWYAMFLALDLGSVVTVLPVVSTYPLVVVAASYALAGEWPRSPALLAAVFAIVAVRPPSKSAERTGEPTRPRAVNCWQCSGRTMSSDTKTSAFRSPATPSPRRGTNRPATVRRRRC
ncbi:DMT family transporter [Halogeometricum sp. CBA1124]|uniref:DMT family transporter n=1 Tax=Halogeometricum sp. CBA1124 TaxID=2668071 RepID=UPI00142A5D2A|nr:DMT family transporter [Halogeometricum sp. CBA1124]MUV56328.1 EamA family transporter [Halogeometricum sp. CBA1124]